MEGGVTIPASVIWSVLAAGCSLIGTLAVMLLRAKEKHADDMMAVSLKAIEASNNTTNALNRLSDLLGRS